MTAPIHTITDRIVGVVEEVSAERILARLDPDAPQATALNTGAPAGFPRINGYVLIPNEGGATACIISSVRIDRLSVPKRLGTQKDFGLVDLPLPSRMMSLTPIGTLKARPAGEALSFRVQRGVDVFPSVGDPVLLPGADQLKAIVEGEEDTAKRIPIGHCPTAGRAPVHVDPDKLFGRHLAVLGNTGAGESCSVAGLVRWSLDAAKKARTAAGRSCKPNARFIVLDPNGEYARAFRDFKVRLFRVDPGTDEDEKVDEPNRESGDEALRVPAWLWNGAEWAAFTGAAPGVQRPVLLQALRRLRSAMGTPDSFESKAIATLHTYRNIFRVAHSTREYLRFPGMKNVRIAFESAQHEIGKLVEEAEIQKPEYVDVLRNAAAACETAADAGRDRQFDQAIDSTHVETAIDRVEQASDAFGLPNAGETGADVPKKFDSRDLPVYVEALAGLAPGRDLAQFVDTLKLRINNLLAPGAIGIHPSTRRW